MPAGLFCLMTERSFVPKMPFDFEQGLQLQASMEANYGDMADAVSPNVSGLISNRWDTGIGEIVGLHRGQPDRQPRYGREAEQDLRVQLHALPGVRDRLSHRCALLRVGLRDAGAASAGTRRRNTE